MATPVIEWRKRSAGKLLIYAKNSRRICAFVLFIFYEWMAAAIGCLRTQAGIIPFKQPRLCELKEATAFTKMGYVLHMLDCAERVLRQVERDMQR